MTEKKPLYITYTETSRSFDIGWGVDSDSVRFLRMSLFSSPESLQVRLVAENKSLAELAHSQAVDFFDSILARDIYIPPSYPYEFWVPGEDTPRYTGKLREKKEDS